MSYQTHGFTSGMKLSGQAMAEMDAQIAANEAAADTLSEQMDAVPGQRLIDIRKISLRADADTIYLEYGPSGSKELLSSVAMPDTGNLIACTGMTATGTLTGLMVGGTGQITVSRQPNDCNQSVRFQSSDTSVATVSSAGLVTAVGSGEASILISCGTYSQTLSVKVSRAVSLAGNVMNDCGSLMYGQTGWQGPMLNAVQYNLNGSNPWIGNVPFSLSKFVLKPGEKVTLTAVDEILRFNKVIIFKEEAGKEMFLADRIETNERYDVFNVTKVAETDTTYETYTYTNSGEEDVYIAFTVDKNGASSADLTDYVEDIDEYISMVIGPA